MEKRLIYAVLATAALLLGPAGPGFASGRGGGPQGGHGAIQSRGSWHGGFRGHAEGGPRVFIGPGVWWGAPWWWWGPAYPYYYAAPPVVVPEAPPVYIQPELPPQRPYYWYYCPNPPGYYPYIKECPPGWMTVVPPANAPPGAPTR
jgi:hypothetical protein